MAADELQKFQTVLKINNAIIHQRSRNGLFKEITGVLQPILGFDRISILVDRQDGKHWNYFSPAIGVSIPELQNNTMPPAKAVIPKRVMQERRTIIVDVVHEPLLPESKMLLDAGLPWFICIPLLVRDQVLGSVQLFYRKSFPLKDDDIDLCEKVSQQVALAVDNMLAYEELEGLKDKLVEEKTYLKKEIDTLKDEQEIVYVCRAMHQIMSTIQNVASTDTTVLLLGETGTGKDLLARAIHNGSGRHNNTFVKLNCAALVPTLIESELFGHEKGAFTGAASKKVGRFELAHQSTLFLDEISELPINTQAKLLQVLQEGAFERVGGTETIRTDVRIIAATNQDLHKMVVEKKFREDLYYRLSTFPVRVPPLRERWEDIPVLGKYFGERFCVRLDRGKPVFDKSAVKVLMQYSWPGNVRELQNFIERVVILKSHQTVTGDDILNLLNPGIQQDTGGETLADIEKKHIENMLRKARGRLGGPNGAAGLLGLKRSTLQYRMKKYGIDASCFRL